MRRILRQGKEIRQRPLLVPISILSWASSIRSGGKRLEGLATAGDDGSRCTCEIVAFRFVPVALGCGLQRRRNTRPTDSLFNSTPTRFRQHDPRLLIFAAFKAGDSVPRGSNGGFDLNVIPPTASPVGHRNFYWYASSAKIP